MPSACGCAVGEIAHGDVVQSAADGIDPSAWIDKEMTVEDITSISQLFKTARSGWGRPEGVFAECFARSMDGRLTDEAARNCMSMKIPHTLDCRCAMTVSSRWP